MRKALIASTSFLTVSVILVSLLFTGNSFSKDEKRGFSALKYNYVIESDLTLTEFSQAFYERLKSKHHWDEVSDDCLGEACYSTWKFTDDDANQWKCEVVIKQAYDEAGISNKMLVSMEMNPVLGS